MQALVSHSAHSSEPFPHPKHLLKMQTHVDKESKFWRDTEWVTYSMYCRGKRAWPAHMQAGVCLASCSLSLSSALFSDNLSIWFDPPVSRVLSPLWGALVSHSAHSSEPFPHPKHLLKMHTHVEKESKFWRDTEWVTYSVYCRGKRAWPAHMQAGVCLESCSLSLSSALFSDNLSIWFDPWFILSLEIPKWVVRIYGNRHKWWV